MAIENQFVFRPTQAADKMSVSNSFKTPTGDTIQLVQLSENSFYINPTDPKSPFPPIVITGTLPTVPTAMTIWEGIKTIAAAGGKDFSWQRWRRRWQMSYYYSSDVYRWETNGPDDYNDV